MDEETAQQTYCTKPQMKRNMDHREDHQHDRVAVPAVAAITKAPVYLLSTATDQEQTGMKRQR